MSCCPHANATGRLFSFFARRYHKRYLKKGLEKTQLQLLKGLSKAGFAKASLLEIGSGVGYLHQHLLLKGADAAVGIDLSNKMLIEAQKLATSQGLDKSTVYLHGDFLNLAPDIDQAEVTILDKVVCCYPDAQTLVTESLKKTTRVYGLTYPRKTWLTKTGEIFMAAMMRILRFDFRSYVHDPVQIEQWVTAQNFRKLYQDQTTIWLTQVYVKNT